MITADLLLLNQEHVLSFSVEAVGVMMAEMDVISRPDFESIIAGARILESDRRGPKVYETPDGKIIKLFRPRGWFCSNLVRPLATRFVNNSKEIRNRGLICVVVENTWKVPHLECQMASYEKLPGISLRECLEKSPPEAIAELIHRFGRYVAEVQNRGVLFRSFHFGNILVLPDGSFGLIDIVDSRFTRGPLRGSQRSRNLRHLTRYPADTEALLPHWDVFEQGYLSSAPPRENPRDFSRFKDILERHRKTLFMSLGLWLLYRLS